MIRVWVLNFSKNKVLFRNCLLKVMMSVEGKAECLCLCLSWASELPGEFRGCRLWDVSVLHQQLLRDPRPAPHLPHPAAPRWPLRLTGGEKSRFLALPTLGRDSRALAWLSALLTEPFPAWSRRTWEIFGCVFYLFESLLSFGRNVCCIRSSVVTEQAEETVCLAH